MQYQITVKSSGADMGTFEAKGAVSAAHAMYRQAGYGSARNASRTLGVTEKSLLDDLEIRLVRMSRTED